MKKHWVNPDCQNSEPTKRTVSSSANVLQYLEKPGSNRVKRDIKKEPSFFLIFYSSVHKIEICLKYFMEKKYQNQPLCGAEKGAMNETQPEKNDATKSTLCQNKTKK
jgi:hypothetical protein